VDVPILTEQHPACRWREAQPGSCKERENLAGDAKGKGSSGATDAHVNVDACDIRIGGMDDPSNIAVGDQTDGGAGVARCRNQLRMPRPIQHQYGNCAAINAFHPGQ